MRPNIRVRAMSRTTIPTFKARTAGKNCTFASHPNHAWIVPVKSRKRSVISVKHIAAAIILIFRNIIISVLCVAKSVIRYKYKKIFNKTFIYGGVNIKKCSLSVGVVLFMVNLIGPGLI
jgi:hypothetical protein